MTESYSNRSMYIPGEFKRICDRCGFVYRASETFRTWDGLFVCEADFETRHPQDFVRGRKDRITVPDPRPEAINTIIGPLTTALTADASGATLTVESSVRFESGDQIGVASEAGTLRRTVDTVPTTTSITITQALGVNVLSGSSVVNYSAVAEPDIG